jgi:hypothetical protein
VPKLQLHGIWVMGIGGIIARPRGFEWVTSEADLQNPEIKAVYLIEASTIRGEMVADFLFCTDGDRYWPQICHPRLSLNICDQAAIRIKIGEWVAQYLG